MTNDFWQDFGSGTFTEIGGDSNSVAIQVLNTFGIPYNPGGFEGGSLPDVDIKRMDALSAIKVSLFEELKNGVLLEMVVNEDGEVEFIEVGGLTSKLTDIYYSVQSNSYYVNKTGVMVTGGTPIPERRVGRYTSILGPKFNAKVWKDADNIMTTCAKTAMDKYCVITYDDLRLTTAYDDGIDNLYETRDPFESILGYAWKIDRGDAADNTKITFSKSAVVPVKISNKLGTLIKPTTTPTDYTGEEDSCLEGLGDLVTCDNASFSFDLPSELTYDTLRNKQYCKFAGVNGIYAVGYKCSYTVLPQTADDMLKTPNDSNSNIWVKFEGSALHLVKLSEGENYGIAYEYGSDYCPTTLCVGLADRSHSVYKEFTFGDNKKLYIKPSDYSLAILASATSIDNQSFLPLDEKTGLVVFELWAAIEIDSPSIQIFDPEGNAVDIAESIDVEVAPIILKSPPAPVVCYSDGYSGVIDLSDGIADHDPTTTQDLSNTEMDQAMDSLAGSGMSITMSSLDEDSTDSLCSNLYNLYKEDSGIETVYMCGPNANPKLGADVGGSVINSIEYRYTDKNSYTISVTTGSKFVGNMVGSLSANEYILKSNDVSGSGMVVQDAGNNVMFKVAIDGIGTREAMNCTPNVIRVGDRVSVTIHNNSIES